MYFLLFLLMLFHCEQKNPKAPLSSISIVNFAKDIRFFRGEPWESRGKGVSRQSFRYPGWCEELLPEVTYLRRDNVCPRSHSQTKQSCQVAP